MKRIVCEICGSSDLVKKDGIYICEYCGSKYSTEEAKKLFVEFDGAVNVVVNKDEENARLKKLGDEAFRNGSWLEATNYYSKFVVSTDVDYETKFRFILAKTQCKENSNNSIPYTGDSIKLALQKINDYTNKLLLDTSLTYDVKVAKINDALTMIDNAIWAVFNEIKDNYITTGLNIPSGLSGYTKVLCPGSDPSPSLQKRMSNG